MKCLVVEEVKLPLKYITGIGYYEDFDMETKFFFSDVANSETVQEVLKRKRKDSWKKATNNEMASLEENEMWQLTLLPKCEKAIPCNWVYRVKTNPDGNIDKYKARLIVKGFIQCRGIEEVPKMTSIYNKIKSSKKP